MRTIWLVGAMGTGKTTIGKIVADRLGVPFRDTDRMVEEAAGASIESIWRTRGEAGFRELETDAVASAAMEGGVVATGGGAVMDARNRAVMTGLVIWLTAAPETIAGRIDGEGRPLLGQADVPARMARIIAEREPLYAAVATHRVATDGRTVEEVADEIVGMVTT